MQLRSARVSSPGSTPIGIFLANALHLSSHNDFWIGVEKMLLLGNSNDMI
jgi:hypothetical protein